jgi:hypothetical protein
MKRIALRGWNVSVEKIFAAEDSEPEWIVTFIEMQPPTGDQITFAMNRKTRDGLVHALTGGIVLAGGELPQL